MYKQGFPDRRLIPAYTQSLQNTGWAACCPPYDVMNAEIQG